MGDLVFDGSQHDTPVGHYTYLVRDDHWVWSEGMYELHGYAAYTLPVTTSLLLQHKHPDDTARAFEVLEKVVRDGRPFSCYHRIIDANKQVRSVLSVGTGVRGDNGAVEQVTGFFVDLTEVQRNETQARLESALVRIAQTRSVIDQAKGMIMMATGCDAADAFDLLRTHSSRTNIKLNWLAHQLVRAVASNSMTTDTASHTAVMSFLDELTMHSLVP